MGGETHVVLSKKEKSESVACSPEVSAMGQIRVEVSNVLGEFPVYNSITSVY